jgi:endonuclease YncB( thermonuclease family)
MLGALGVITPARSSKAFSTQAHRPLHHRVLRLRIAAAGGQVLGSIVAVSEVAAVRGPEPTGRIARLFVLLTCLGLFTFSVGAAEGIKGKVVGISDGDTITVLTPEKEQVKVRLAEIDTPEACQPYGARARQILSDLAFSKNVRVVVVDRDRYGRTVGRVYAGNLDVNAEMVRSGAAWVYREYSSDAFLLDVEEEARSAKRGIWALPEAERSPPWEWRRAQRSSQGRSDTGNRREDASRSAPAERDGFSCGAKQTCKAMASCAEARFYLRGCGLSRLDGDHDGMPCEKLCR